MKKNVFINIFLAVILFSIFSCGDPFDTDDIVGSEWVDDSGSDFMIRFITDRAFNKFEVEDNVEEFYHSFYYVYDSETLTGYSVTNLIVEPDFGVGTKFTISDDGLSLTFWNNFGGNEFYTRKLF